MHRIKISSIAVLLLLSAAFVWAQEPQREETKPPREQEPAARPPRDAAPAHQPADEARPPRQQEEMKPPQQEEMKPQRQEKSEKQENRPQKDEARPAHEQHGQDRPGQRAQQGQRQRPPRGQERRIPEERFRASFGRQHTFVINRPVVVEGQPRFQYSGYWFEIYDPWPAEWVYTDNFYIDYVDDDYYLFDALHPGYRVVVFVVM